MLASPAVSAPWQTHAPIELSPSDTSVVIDVGEKIGLIDNIRFQIEGSTVALDALTIIPPKGDPIALRIPAMLKSGESSGLINIPGKGAIIDSLRLQYRITTGKPAQITFRFKPD